MSIEGMTAPDECLFLTELARDVQTGVIVEIGSYRGRSTVALALGSKHGAGRPVFAVEPHERFSGEYGAEFGPDDRTAFGENVRRAGVESLVTLIGDRSEVAAGSWAEPIGLLWIDGDHTYEAVRRDFDAWSPYLVDGARVAFHDSTRAGLGPYRVVQEAMSAGAEKVGEVGKITVLRFRR